MKLACTEFYVKYNIYALYIKDLCLEVFEQHCGFEIKIFTQPQKNKKEKTFISRPLYENLRRSTYKCGFTATFE